MEIPRDRLEVRYARSSGPGGQHVNTTDTKVEVRFQLDDADWIPPAVRVRLRRDEARRITREGEFRLVSSRYRSQRRNLEDCIERLRLILERASRPRKVRKPTRPTRASRERRLKGKRERSATKSQRRWRPDD